MPWILSKEGFKGKLRSWFPLKKRRSWFPFKNNPLKSLRENPTLSWNNVQDEHKELIMNLEIKKGYRMIKKRFFYNFFIIFLWTMPVISFGFKNSLEFPAEKDSILSLEPAIANIVVQKNRIILLPAYKIFTVMINKNLALKTREERFGKLIQMQKKEIPRTESFQNFTAGIPYEDDQYLLLDGEKLELFWLNKDDKFISKRSIIWDLILPPLDRGQEAADWLIKKLRTRFTEHLKKSHVKIVGLAPLKDPQNKELTFLASTQIPGYPFVLLSCDKLNVNNCQIKRACSLDGPLLNSSSLWGLSVDEKKEKTPTLFVLDQKKHKILLFHYFSCLHIEPFKEVSLPQRLYTPSGLFIDENDHLWVTTLKPDDFLNASVYMWEASQWQ